MNKNLIFVLTTDETQRNIFNIFAVKTIYKYKVTDQFFKNVSRGTIYIIFNNKNLLTWT